MDNLQTGILKKFQYLKGEVILGKKEIKGENNLDKVPADVFANEPHILHDLIRGFYKPAGKPYLLSYQATESEENYGKQIIWDKLSENFLKINMHPPRGEKDNRKISDVRAARYNMENGIPFGILHKIAKGQNKILGLGKIVSEQEDGIFIVEPYQLVYDFKKEISFIEKNLKKEEFDTNVVGRATFRRGQRIFKDNILKNSQKCVICGIDDISFLHASHIKPWKMSSHKERLDGFNGFLMCPNHDKIFDRGYISFTDNGEILISPRLTNNTKLNMNLNNKIKISILPETFKYLKWHRENCFISI